MSRHTAFEFAADRNKPARSKATRQDLIRNARARKKLERRRDRDRLRKDIEEVWN